MDSVYYSKTMCERCYNKECSQHGRRNIHMDKKNFICKNFIDETLSRWKEKIKEQYEDNEYHMYDGVW